MDLSRWLRVRLILFVFAFLSLLSARASELAGMSGGGDSLWTGFYESLSATRQYHAKFPNAGRLAHRSTAAATTHATATADGTATEDNAIIDDGVGGTVGKIHFTPEEAFGARVDMNALFERYINLPQFSRHTDYITFLDTFHLFDKIPREKKIKFQRDEYRKWLVSVRTYLCDYFHRVHPLVELSDLTTLIAAEFEEAWNGKTLPGWFGTNGASAAEGETAAATAATPALAAAEGASTDAAAAAPSTNADASNPLYCVACAKLFAKQTVFDAHLPGKKHKKNEEILAALNGNTTPAATATPGATDSTTTNGAADSTSLVSKLADDCRSLALLEFEIHHLASLLSTQLQTTRDHIIKKSTRTYEEISAELAEQQEAIAKAKEAIKDGNKNEEEEEEEDEHAPVYNPLNLPLGFDGKPIPYWLYKLHGLNLKFDCEICGGFTYWGPRNFERHFTEWRHAYGMRALGIPNTKHFAHITKMADATALFEKLKKEGVGAGWRAEDEEEYEDSEGNVFNKRTYLELQRQGLI